MITTQAPNPCIRCGKERIVSKTWKEKVETYRGITTIEHTETVCPDPECQRIVDRELDAKKEKEGGN